MQAEGVSFNQFKRLNLHVQAVVFHFGPLDMGNLYHMNSKSVVGLVLVLDIFQNHINSIGTKIINNTHYINCDKNYKLTC